MPDPAPREAAAELFGGRLAPTPPPPEPVPMSWPLQVAVFGGIVNPNQEEKP